MHLEFYGEQDLIEETHAFQGMGFFYILLFKMNITDRCLCLLVLQLRIIY